MTWPASPNGESLAIVTASSSVSKSMTTTTGPNTSSRATLAEFVTSVSTVGW